VTETRLAPLSTLALALGLLGPAAAWPQQVELSGLSAGHAILVIDGAAPRLLSTGQSVSGVKLLQVNTDSVMLEVAGEQRRLQLGAGPIAPSKADPKRHIVLTADASGHFITGGLINGQSVPLLVDTGATAVTVDQTLAQRLGLDIRQGKPVQVRTANGTVMGHQVELRSLRVGHHTSYNVVAVVLPTGLPHVLLGNSYLARFRLQRDDQRMTLEPKY